MNKDEMNSLREYVYNYGCKPMLTNSFDCCKPAPVAQSYMNSLPAPCKEEGNNPMRNEMSIAITGAGTPAKSDEMIQREYLISRFTNTYDGWRDTMNDKLREMFKMDANGRPEKATDLIDAIKAGKYTLDQKKLDRVAEDQEEDSQDDYDVLTGYGVFYALDFTDFPKPDQKGFRAAQVEWTAAKQSVKDTIMIASPADGLKALEALATWVPTGKPN